MRLTIAVFTAALLVNSSAFAQTQQAGSEAATNAEETFKKLVAKCDDVDALVLRARVRLAMGRLDDQAAVEELTKSDEYYLINSGQYLVLHAFNPGKKETHNCDAAKVFIDKQTNLSKCFGKCFYLKLRHVDGGAGGNCSVMTSCLQSS